MKKLLLVICVLLAGIWSHGVALADVRKQCAQAFPEGITNLGALGNVCFSGHRCVVGVRGAWLDLTEDVSRLRGPGADIRIIQKGTDRNPSTSGCVPEGNSDREGFVMIEITNISGTGDLEIRLRRPNLALGHDMDKITVTVLSGRTFLRNNEEFSAVKNEQTRLRIRGAHLQFLRLKNPGPTDQILESHENEAIVQLTFTQTGTINLDERLMFSGPVSEISQRAGFPVVNVRNPPSEGPAGPRITLTTNGSGEGTVRSTPGGISCPTDCTSTFEQFTNVALRAEPSANSKFITWTGACASAGNNPDCAIYNSDGADATAGAQFTRVFVLTITKTGSGTVSGGPINCGETCTVAFENANATVTLTALPSPGGTFRGWSGACEGQAPCVIRMNGAASQVTARFTP